MILVVGEVQSGRLNAATLEALSGAQQMNGPVAVVVAGHGVADALVALSGAEVEDLVALEHEALARYTPDGFVAALSRFITDARPAWVVCPHTYQARDFVPALAA